MQTGKFFRCIVLANLIGWVVLAVVGCSRQESQSGSLESGEAESMKLAVTTSIRDSGLLDHVLPEFEKQSGIRVDVVAAGTGSALRMARGGDVDAVWVHSYAAEMEFMEQGYGCRREDVMHNAFLLLGPENDPAGIQRLPIAAALRQLRQKNANFLSRGDESGTHQKEQQLFEMAEVEPGWENYRESGQGMGASLTMADQLQAHLLCDQGTYARFRQKTQLVALVSGEPILNNRYGFLVVAPQRHPAANHAAAQRLADFLISETGRNRIRSYRLNGQPVFFPAGDN